MRSSTRQATACFFAIFSVAVLVNAQTNTIKEPGATITGKITIKGQAAFGVIVVLRRNDRPTGGREYSGLKGVSDTEGNYRIGNVPPGSYRVVPAAKAFVPVNDSDLEKIVIVNRSETIEQIDFALVPGGVITGKLVDSEGHPVVDEWVSVFTVPDNREVSVLGNSTSDDRGVYRIYGLRAGSYRVVAGRGEETFSDGSPRPYRRTYHPSASDPSQAAVVEVSEGRATKDVDITFTRTVSTYTARGRIVDAETGQPLANIDYGITRYDGRNSSTRSGGYRSNNRGEFTLTNLAPGKYSIPISRSSENDLRFEEIQFEIVDQDVNDLVIKGTQGGSVSGMVVFENVDDKTREQLGRGWIMASMDGVPGRSTGSSTQLAADGSFHLRGLPGGTAILQLYFNNQIRIERVERDGVIQPRGVAIREREHIKGIRVFAQLGNASIRGTIQVENGTFPADGQFFASARLLGADPATFSGANWRLQVDARGNFVIENLTPGTYEIEGGVQLKSGKLAYWARKQQVVVTSGSTNTVNMTVDLSSTPKEQ